MRQPLPLHAGSRPLSQSPRKGDLKEAAILDTAWQLLATRPIAQISIEDLAGGAGISRSTFYFYFESKDAVLYALATRVADEVRSAWAPLFETGPNTTEADLRRAIAAYMQRWKSKGPALRAMSTLAETDGTLRAFWEQVSGELLAAAAAGLQQQRDAGLALPAPPDAQDLVNVLFAMLWRAGYELSLKPVSRAQEQRLVEGLTAVIVRSCYGTNA